jgi:hypothetical protein
MDIIVDIDGTLADCTHRLRHIQKQPKDWDAFFADCGKDAPINTVINIVEALGLASNTIIFCSGRPERCRADTEQWLRTMLNYVAPTPLYMRPDGDRRDDQIVKRELLARIRADGFNPVLAIDDRSRVVAMWRAEGLICAQVAEGDF